MPGRHKSVLRRRDRTQRPPAGAARARRRATWRGSGSPGSAASSPRWHVPGAAAGDHVAPLPQRPQGKGVAQAVGADAFGVDAGLAGAAYDDIARRPSGATMAPPLDRNARSPQRRGPRTAMHCTAGFRPHRARRSGQHHRRSRYTGAQAAAGYRRASIAAARLVRPRLQGARGRVANAGALGCARWS